MLCHMSISLSLYLLIGATGPLVGVHRWVSNRTEAWSFRQDSAQELQSQVRNALLALAEGFTPFIGKTCQERLPIGKQMMTE